MTHRSSLPLRLLLVGTLLYSGCGSHDGGGSTPPPPPPPPPAYTQEVEPNDSAATATPLGSSLVGTGELPAGSTDMDFWSFTATATDHLQIEVFAARFDQAGWDQNANPIVTTLYAADGSTVLRVATYSSPSFSRDHDIAAFRVPVTGTYYLKFAPLGPGRGNEYGKYCFRITTLPLPGLQTETEPAGSTGVNDTAGTAQSMSAGTLYGYHTDGNLDYYSIAVTAPVHVDITILAYRLGRDGSNSSDYDTVVDLIDTNGTTVLKSDDNNIFLDSGFRYQVNTSGTYYIRVSEAATSTVSAPYYLTYATFAVTSAEVESNDTIGVATPIAYDTIVSGTTDSADPDNFSFTAAAGDVVQAYLMATSESYQGGPAVAYPMVTYYKTDGSVIFGSSGFADHRCVALQMVASGTFIARVTTSTGTATPYSLHLRRWSACTFETEPNDAIATATPMPVDGKSGGRIGTPGDADYLSFSATAGELVVVECAPPTITDELFAGIAIPAPVLAIVDSVGATVATADSMISTAEAAGTAQPEFRVGAAFLAPANGTYFVRVTDGLGASGTYVSYFVRRR